MDNDCNSSLNNQNTGSDLYADYLNGNKEAYAEIVEFYKNPLMLFINTFVNNIHIAEELTQETFVSIGVKKPKFNGKSSFKTWLFAVGRNITLSFLRKHSREELTDDSDLFSVFDDTVDIEKQYLVESDRIAVHQAISKLSDDYRQVIWLSYFEELDNNEIAKVMKKSKHSVETLKYRAKESLRKILEKEGFIYENR